MILPDWRRAFSGRTFSQPWEPAALERPRPGKVSEVLWLLFVGAGIALALFAIFYSETGP